MKVELAAHPLDLAEETRIDFPGCEGLRAKIVAALESGDADLLGQLQREHRETRRRFAGMTRTAVIIPVQSSSPTVLRTPTSATSTVPRDVTREFRGYTVCWGPTLTATGLGDEPAVIADVQPHDLREWIARVDPALIPVRGNHATEPCGHCHSFVMDEVGLMTVGTIDRTPAGDVLMEACDNGAAGGLSVHMNMSRFRDTGQVQDGLPVFAGGPLDIVEAGPVVTPSDDRCVIELIRGQRPLWRLQQDAAERAEVLARMRH